MRKIQFRSSFNSIRNKFDYFYKEIKGNVDILLVSEIKIDDSFLQGQCVIGGSSVPYRLDLNCLGGDLILFVREDIPFEEAAIESFNVELSYGITSGFQIALVILIKTA